METRLLIDAAGWIGMAGLLSAYWLVSTNRVRGTSRLYQTLNVIGAGGLLANTLYYRAYPAAALNSVWLCIGVIACVRAVVRLHRGRSATGSDG